MKVYEISRYDWYCDSTVYYIVSAETREEAETKFMSGRLLKEKDFIRVQEIDITEPYFVA
jgi:hypothetical protein